jgi:hypothetical protein
VTGQLIAPVIPSAAGPAHHRTGMPGRPGAARSLPLARPPATLSLPAGVVYGMGRIDASGRVCDRAVTATLSWQAGDRLTLTAAAGVVIARRDPGGMIILSGRPSVAIPAALRRRCGLRAGDRVLLAAAPGQDTLTVYSLAVVDQAIRASDLHLPGGGGAS